MDQNALPLFQAMRHKMAWLIQRQEVLAQNIANADTPGFQAQDLQPYSFQATLRERSMALETSHPGHIVTRSASVVADERRDSRVFETAPAGNSVVLEDQIMKASANAADYQLMLNLYRKQTGILRAAIGRPQQG